MSIRTIIYTCLVAAYIVCAAPAYAQVAQPAAWSSTPTMSDERNMSYQFRSTSSYSPIVGTTSYMSDGSGPVSEPQHVQRRGLWDDPTDDPIGVVPNQPIGDIPWALMLLLTAGYIAHTAIRKRRHANA